MLCNFLNYCTVWDKHQTIEAFRALPFDKTHEKKKKTDPGDVLNSVVWFAQAF